MRAQLPGKSNQRDFAAHSSNCCITSRYSASHSSGSMASARTAPADSRRIASSKTSRHTRSSETDWLVRDGRSDPLDIEHPRDHARIGTFHEWPECRAAALPDLQNLCRAEQCRRLVTPSLHEGDCCAQELGEDTVSWIERVRVMPRPPRPAGAEACERAWRFAVALDPGQRHRSMRNIRSSMRRSHCSTAARKSVRSGSSMSNGCGMRSRSANKAGQAIGSFVTGRPAYPGKTARPAASISSSPNAQFPI
jgi:hypothetical protein